MEAELSWKDIHHYVGTIWVYLRKTLSLSLAIFAFIRIDGLVGKAIEHI